jgi:hypothetical protein
MGKRKGHRGKAGGRLRFLRALKKELNSVKDFDPSNFWAESPPSEEAFMEETLESKSPPPRNLLLEILEFRSRAAKARALEIPERIQTRPAPLTVYTRKLVANRTLPRILSNIAVNIKLRIC